MAVCLAGLLCPIMAVKAQWVTFDPSNFAQSIVNTTRNVVQTTTTAENMVKNFQETVKIYEQGKRYYDALKAVNNLVKDARKVQQTVLLVGEISDIYVKLFPENADGRELYAGRAFGNRFRICEDAGREQRYAERDEDGRNLHQPFHDG